jgi:hypothetical protein
MVDELNELGIELMVSYLISFLLCLS